MFKFLFVLFISLTVKLNAQSPLKYFPVSIFLNSAKINPSIKIFDEFYVIGYNTKGQLLYGNVNITDAADHNGYSIILYNAVTKKNKVLNALGMEDSLNTFENFKQFFDANKKIMQKQMELYKLVNKQPAISIIKKQDYNLQQNCKEEYDWYTCSCKARYKKQKPFTIIVEGAPNKTDKPTLFKLIQFNKYKIVLYNTIQRGWEGTPFVVRYGLQ